MCQIRNFDEHLTRHLCAAEAAQEHNYLFERNQISIIREIWCYLALMNSTLISSNARKYLAKITQITFT